MKEGGRGGQRLNIWEFPKIRGTIFRVPRKRTLAFWGLYWGPLFWETIICFEGCLIAIVAVVVVVDAAVTVP